MAGIDSLFQRVRRSINSLGGCIGIAGKGGRIWYGCSPYNPVIVEKFSDIHRTAANFAGVSRDGRTPAMRLGLAKGIVDADEILYLSLASIRNKTIINESFVQNHGKSAAAFRSKTRTCQTVSKSPKT